MKQLIPRITIKCQNINCSNSLNIKESDVGKKKFCSIHCKVSSPRTPRSKRYCLNCKNEFEQKITVYTKYCSRKCKDIHQKELYKGKGNPMFGLEISEETREKHSNASKAIWKSDDHREKVKIGTKKFLEKNGYWFGWSKESQEKRIQTNLDKFGVDHAWKSPELREKADQTRIERYGKTLSEMGFDSLKNGNGNTSIEYKFEEFLIENKIEYKAQFRIYHANRFKVFDFCLKQFNLLIEIDGDYWHGNPDFFPDLNSTQLKNITNDIFKTQLAIEKGYDVIRFWENNINSGEYKTKFLELINTLNGN
jgi:very-short-patch-repair endonuclease